MNVYFTSDYVSADESVDTRYCDIAEANVSCRLATNIDHARHSEVNDKHLFLESVFSNRLKNQNLAGIVRDRITEEL